MATDARPTRFSLKNMLISALLITIFLIAYVVYVFARIVANDLTDATFYTGALEENDIYDRVYTELLADPELQDVSNDLLGDLNLSPSQSEDVSSYAVSTLRLVLPPERIQLAIEAAINELLAYFRGDLPRYEASLNLTGTLDDPELAETLTVYVQGLVTNLLTEWLASAPSDSAVRPSEEEIAAFTDELQAFASNLAAGDLSRIPDAATFIDIRQVPVEERIVFAEALIEPIQGDISPEIRNQIEAALAAGDLESAISIATTQLIKPYLEVATLELQGALEDGQLDGVRSVAELAEDTEEKVVGNLNLIRDVIVALREGYIIPLFTIIAILSIAGLGWLHADNLRRAMRVVGWTLVGSSLLLTVLFVIGIIAIAAPLDELTNADHLTLPTSLRNMTNDVLISLIEEMWEALWNRTGVIFLAGVVLLVLGYLPAVSNVSRWLFRETREEFEELTGISLSRRRNAFAVTIAVVLLALALIDGVFSDETPVAAADVGCNGHVELCDRPLNEVVFATTHNSMSISSVGWVWPTHDGGITEQLQAGVRGFLIDTHYWQTEAQIDSYLVGLPPDMLPTVENLLAEQSTLLDDLSRDGVYTCHGLCLLGATPLVDMFTEFRAFLGDNPDEVLVFIIQDAISVEDTEAAMQESGLIDYVYTPESRSEWPTLGEMIAADTRLVVMAEEAEDGPEWYVNAWAYTQENPYSIASLDDFSCAPNRGETDNALFLLNHWIDRVSPSRVDATRVNSYEFLMAQVRACQAERGQLPNLVAVNFYSLGDLMRVVDELNGFEVEVIEVSP